MSKVFIQMSMSLDGYVAGPNDSDVNGLGDGGIRLFGELRNPPVELEQMTVTSSKAVTHLRYRVLPRNAAG